MQYGVLLHVPLNIYSFFSFSTILSAPFPRVPSIKWHGRRSVQMFSWVVPQIGLFNSGDRTSRHPCFVLTLNRRLCLISCGLRTVLLSLELSARVRWKSGTWESVGKILCSVAFIILNNNNYYVFSSYFNIILKCLVLRVFFCPAVYSALIFFNSLDPTIVSETSSGVNPTALLFTTETDCVLVGDSEGGVTVYKLKNLKPGGSTQVRPDLFMSMWLDVCGTVLKVIQVIKVQCQDHLYLLCFCRWRRWRK